MLKKQNEKKGIHIIGNTLLFRMEPGLGHIYSASFFVLLLLLPSLVVCKQQ